MSTIPKAKIRGFEVAKGFEGEDVILPTQATEGSAGYDFYCVEDVVVPVGADLPVLVKTGVKAYMRKDEVLELYIRSSVALKQGLILANGTGIVDATFFQNPTDDGHIRFMFRNLSAQNVMIKKGDRIGQGIFKKYLTADSGNSKKQREGGFGSSGK